MTPEADSPGAARPAVATACGLVLATALLQIGQQIASVFAPRPAIQVALIVAVGLGALVGERVQRKDRRPRDPLLISSSIGCFAAIGVAGLLWASLGFSTEPTPSIAQQIQAIRDDARRSGLTESKYERVTLRPGAYAYVFVFDPAEGRSITRSSEVRVYEEQRGRLQRRLRFRPTRPPGVYVADAGAKRVIFDPHKQVAYGVRFQASTTADLNKDGQTEILGDFSMQSPSNLTTLKIPVTITWSAAQDRYAILPVIKRTPALGRVPPLESSVDARGFQTRFHLRDPRTGYEVSGYAVSDYLARVQEHDVIADFVSGYNARTHVVQAAGWFVTRLSAGATQECYSGHARAGLFTLPGGSALLSPRQLSELLPTGPQGVIIGSDCLTGE